MHIQATDKHSKGLYIKKEEYWYMRRYTKIVATIGPASDTRKSIKRLYDAGMDVARLNFSHGSHEYFEEVIKRIRSVSTSIAILLDSKGPEIRVGQIRQDACILSKNKELILTKENIIGDSQRVPVRYPYLDSIKAGSKIFLDDGFIELKVKRKEKGQLITKVIDGGLLRSRKTVSIRGHSIRLPFISKDDRKDIEFGIRHNVDFIAASFVRKQQDIKQLSKMLEKRRSYIKIISKIEHWQAMENIDEIIDASWGIMIARGDLGVEVPLEKVPRYQDEIIQKCKRKGKPTIVATQMLESMKQSPRPTRAEVSDVAQAIIQGADALMLSAETTIGKYPSQAVAMMNTIAKEYDPYVKEDLVHYTKKDFSKGRFPVSMNVTNAAYQAARSLPIKLIITPTETGSTARNVSRFKPKTPILAITCDDTVHRQLKLSWGVTALLESSRYSCAKTYIASVLKAMVKRKEIKAKDLIVLTSGSKLHMPGSTNVLEIHEVKELIAEAAR